MSMWDWMARCVTLGYVAYVVGRLVIRVVGRLMGVW